jgi:hypothetical protein
MPFGEIAFYIVNIAVAVILILSRRIGEVPKWLKDHVTKEYTP